MDDLYRLKTELNEYWMDYDDGSCADKISIPAWQEYTVGNDDDDDYNDGDDDIDDDDDDDYDDDDDNDDYDDALTRSAFPRDRHTHCVCITQWASGQEWTRNRVEFRCYRPKEEDNQL